jgi:hypothetical protein
MICNPLDKCCEIVSSNCVAFIGHLPENSTLCLADNSLTTFLLGVDSSLTDLSKGSHILKTTLDNINTCVPKKIIDTADIPLKQRVCNNKVVSEYYYTSDIVAQLVGNNCVLQTRLNLIYTEVNNPLKPQTKGKLTEDFMNFELPNSYIDKFRCLLCEEVCDSQTVTTIGDLLEVMAKKILAFQEKLNVSQGICKDCY